MNYNIYYNPGEFGLTQVLMFDASKGWDFDYLVVWQDKNNKLWWAYDSGCSCPNPFENTNLDNINPLPETLEDLKQTAKDMVSDSKLEPQSLKRDFLIKLNKLLRDNQK